VAEDEIVDSITNSTDMSLNKLCEIVKDREACSPWCRKEQDTTERLNEDKVGVKVSHCYSDLHLPAH